jgi:hypothetical protein
MPRFNWDAIRRRAYERAIAEGESEEEAEEAGEQAVSDAADYAYQMSRDDKLDNAR